MQATPAITIITPSFNQAAFLEATIRSVLDQNYPRLQYGIVDGGSTDGSRQIIEHYRDRLSFAIIEHDNGQAEAINKGLRRAEGDVVGWLCSDDLLLPGSLHAIGSAFAKESCHWLAGACQMVDEHGRLIEEQRPSGVFTVPGVLLRGMQRPFCLPQPSVFWRRSLHDELGLLREDLHYCMDFEWWLRLLSAGYRPRTIRQALSAYRLHDASKSVAQTSGFLREHLSVEPAYAGSLSWRQRVRFMRRMGYLERMHALQTPNASPWQLVARRPWWLLSQQVRQALRTAA